jgi:hypothetical protein
MGFGFRVSRFGIRDQRHGKLGFGLRVSESVGYKLGFGFRSKCGLQVALGFGFWVDLQYAMTTEPGAPGGEKVTALPRARAASKKLSKLWSDAPPLKSAAG